MVNQNKKNYANFSPKIAMQAFEANHKWIYCKSICRLFPELLMIAWETFWAKTLVALGAHIAGSDAFSMRSSTVLLLAYRQSFHVMINIW